LNDFALSCPEWRPTVMKLRIQQQERKFDRMKSTELLKVSLGWLVGSEELKKTWIHFRDNSLSIKTVVRGPPATRSQVSNSPTPNNVRPEITWLRKVDSQCDYANWIALGW